MGWTEGGDGKNTTTVHLYIMITNNNNNKYTRECLSVGAVVGGSFAFCVCPRAVRGWYWMIMSSPSHHHILGSCGGGTGLGRIYCKWTRESNEWIEWTKTHSLLNLFAGRKGELR